MCESKELRTCSAGRPRPANRSKRPNFLFFSSYFSCSLPLIPVINYLVRKEEELITQNDVCARPAHARSLARSLSRRRFLSSAYRHSVLEACIERSSGENALHREAQSILECCEEFKVSSCSTFCPFPPLAHRSQEPSSHPLLSKCRKCGCLDRGRVERGSQPSS